MYDFSFSICFIIDLPILGTIDIRNAVCVCVFFKLINLDLDG